MLCRLALRVIKPTNHPKVPHIPHVSAEKSQPPHPDDGDFLDDYEVVFYHTNEQGNVVAISEVNMKKAHRYCRVLGCFLLLSVITIAFGLAIITLFLPGGNIGWIEYEHFGSGRTIAEGMQIDQPELNEISSKTLEIMRQEGGNNIEHLLRLAPCLKKRADMVDVAYKGSSCVTCIPIEFFSSYHNENPADAEAIDEFVEIALALINKSER